MYKPSSSAIKVDHGFDAHCLETFLKKVIGGIKGGMQLERIGGGQSNPTFFVTFDNRRLVLRKKPVNALPSAHAVDREYRIMRALRDSNVPVPDTVLYHGSPDVIGAPFYVMDRIDGRVFSDCALPGVPPAERRTMYLAMAETLAALHNLDWKAVGLADYGKPGNYFSRQIARWLKQWEQSRTRDSLEIERLTKWLPANIPRNDVTAISHGDFRIGNLMFHSTEPRVVGVLDWELSTLGHPLADLAYCALAWHLLPTEYMGVRGLDLVTLGIPSEQEFLNLYGKLTDNDEQIGAFHYAFSLFRLAVIFEGISARARSGDACSDNASEVGKLSIVFAQRANEIIDSAMAP